MPRRLIRARLPAPTRDRGAEHRAERVAHGEHPTVGGRVVEARAPAGMIRGLALGPGEPLPTAERGYFESRLGADLSAVRIHPGAAAATHLRANAFTVGRDIGLAPGRFRPGTREGRLLLAHELAHVVQQGAVRLAPPTGIGAANHPAEREADRAALHVLSGAGGRPSLTLLPAGSGARIQCQPANPSPSPAISAPAAPGPAELRDDDRALLGTWGIALDDADEHRLAADFPQGFLMSGGDGFLFIATSANLAQGVRLRGYRVVQPTPLDAGIESYIFQVGKGRAILVSSVSGAGSTMLDLGVDQTGRTTGAARLLNAVIDLNTAGAAALPTRAILSHTDADHMNAAFAFLTHPAFRGMTLDVAREQLRSAVGQADWATMRLNLVPANQVVEIEVTGTASAGSRLGPTGAQVHVRKGIVGDFELTEFRSVAAHLSMTDPGRRTFDKNRTSPVTVILDLVTGDRFLFTGDAGLRQITEIVTAIGETAFLRILGAEGRNLRLYEPPHHGGAVKGPDVAGMITALRLAYEAGGGATRLVMQTSESFIAAGGPSSFRFLEAAGVALDPVLTDPSPAGTHQATRARGGALERVTYDATGIQAVQGLVRAQQPVLDAAYAKLGEIRELQATARLMHEGLSRAGAPLQLIRSLEQIRTDLAAHEQAFYAAVNPVWTQLEAAAGGKAGARDSRDLSGVAARMAALGTQARAINLAGVRENLDTHSAGMSAYGLAFTTLVSMMNALRSRNYQELHRLRGEYDANLRALRGILGKRVVAEHVRATWASIAAEWTPERFDTIARRLGSEVRAQRIVSTHYRVELMESLTRQAQLNEMVERAMTGRQRYGPGGTPQMTAGTRTGAGFLLALEVGRMALDFWNTQEAASAAADARAAADRKEGYQTVRWWFAQGATPWVGLVSGKRVISSAMSQEQVLDILSGKKTDGVPDYDRAVVVDVPLEDLLFMIHANLLEVQNLSDWHELNDANPSGPAFKRFDNGWGVRLWSLQEHRYTYVKRDEIQQPLEALRQRLELGQQRTFEERVEKSDGTGGGAEGHGLVLWLGPVRLRLQPGGEARAHRLRRDRPELGAAWGPVARWGQVRPRAGGGPPHVPAARRVLLALGSLAKFRPARELDDLPGEAQCPGVCPGRSRQSPLPPEAHGRPQGPQEPAMNRTRTGPHRDGPAPHLGRRRGGEDDPGRTLRPPPWPVA